MTKTHDIPFVERTPAYSSTYSSTYSSKNPCVTPPKRTGVDVDESVRTDGIYDNRVEFETFTVAIPISASFTRHLDVQAPTADAALLLATEHALDTGVLMHGEPWIVKGAG